MAPARSEAAPHDTSNNVHPTIPPPAGPHPSYIQVAKPYVFERTVHECIAATGVDQLREDNIRLQGITWIDNVRKALHLYVWAFNPFPGLFSFFYSSLSRSTTDISGTDQSALSTLRLFIIINSGLYTRKASTTISYV